MVLLRALLLPARCVQLVVDATSKDWSLHSRPLTSILSWPYLYQCRQRWDLCYTVAVNIQSMPSVPSTASDDQLRLLSKGGDKSMGTQHCHVQPLCCIIQDASSLCYLWLHLAWLLMAWFAYSQVASIPISKTFPVNRPAIFFIPHASISTPSGTLTSSKTSNSSPNSVKSFFADGSWRSSWHQCVWLCSCHAL